MTATTATSGRLNVGDVWRLGVAVVDDDTGQPAAAAVTAEVTLPDDTTAAPPVEQLSTGEYVAEHTLTQPGRHIGVLTASGDVVAVVVFAVTADEPTADLPDVEAIKNYLKESAAQWSDADLTDALDAETANQAQVCRIEGVYPADLAQALKRRVAVNLARRALPLAVLQSDAEAGNVVMPGRDPEVRRLEGPHRKVIFA